MQVEKKNIDWGNLNFGYIQTEKRYVSYFKDGSWDEGILTDDANIVLNECSGVLQYAQTIFEGLKAYTTEDGHIVAFRPDLNGERMEDSARRLEMPVFARERFVDAVAQVVAANAAYVPPYGSGATLYVRPYMFFVRCEFRNRREACGRISVSYFLHACGTLFQGRRKAADHLRQRF